MKAVNDNLEARFKNNACVVLLNGMKLTFYKILEAKAFIDDYYKREI